MVYRRIVNTGIALLICVSLLLVFPGPALAMPFQTAVNYPAGGTAGYIAVGDFNNDGKPDVATVVNNINSVSILINKGGGAFNAPVTYSVGSSPQDIELGDFNRDGKLDLAIPNGSKYVSILLGNGDGTFNAAVRYTVGNGPLVAAVGDFNRDGAADIAVTSNQIGCVSILLGNGDGTFNTVVNYTAGNQPYGLAVGDFNSDGKLDLAATNYNNSSLSILLGKGDGTFNAPVNYSVGQGPQDIVVADFNGDSKLDLAAVNDSSNNISILLGKGDGTFNSAVNYAVGVYPTNAVAGDFNYDGKPDLAVANYSNSTVSVLIGKGDGTFDAAVTCQVGGYPWGIATGDFNSHDAVDLVTGNHGDSNVSILFNTARPTTTTTASFNTSLGAVNLNTDAGTLSNATWGAPASMNLSSLSGFIFPYGMFGFNITGITPGQTVRITLTLPNPLPLGTQYFKFINNSLVDVTSLVTRVNTNTLQLALTDGGLGDADGIANGTIVDPGGPAFRLSPNPVTHQSSIPTTPQAPVSLSNITVKSASLSATKVTPGTPITVTADLTNTGTGNGTSVVKVYVNGAEEAQQGVRVNGGSTTQVSFNVSRSEPGAYTVYVGGTNAGSFIVDQFTPETILYISGSLVLFAFIMGVIWITRRRTS